MFETKDRGVIPNSSNINNEETGITSRQNIKLERIYKIRDKIKNAKELTESEIIHFFGLREKHLQVYPNDPILDKIDELSYFNKVIQPQDKTKAASFLVRRIHYNLFRHPTEDYIDKVLPFICSNGDVETAYELVNGYYTTYTGFDPFSKEISSQFIIKNTDHRIAETLAYSCAFRCSYWGNIEYKDNTKLKLVLEKGDEKAAYCMAMGLNENSNLRSNNEDYISKILDFIIEKGDYRSTDELLGAERWIKFSKSQLDRIKCFQKEKNKEYIKSKIRKANDPESLIILSSDIEDGFITGIQIRQSLRKIFKDGDYNSVNHLASAILKGRFSNAKIQKQVWEFIYREGDKETASILLDQISDRNSNDDFDQAKEFIRSRLS